MRVNPGAAAVAKALASVRIDSEFIQMTGGLDEVTAPLARAPGTARLALNFDCAISPDKQNPSGYRRVKGYERYDGRPAPSAAQYAILYANITGSVAVGNTLTGAGGATGVIIALPAGNASFVLTKVTGTFVDAENLNVGGPTIATAIGTQVVGGALTTKLNAQYLNLAADNYRADIAAVPGSGMVRGVWMLNNIRYAFRNNAGGTACVMYKSSVTGWTLVAFEYFVTYTVGNGSVDDGDTLTQGGVTATVRRVLVRTGALAGGTAVGSLVISAPAGGNFAAGAATTTGGGTLTLDGVQTAVTLSPGGTFEFTNENFGGAITTPRMYGCDGVNKGFEFDGNYFVPIPTGMVVDTPNHITGHKKHLFFSFMGSVQHSGIGAPYTWSVTLGASEIVMGDTVTAFSKQPGSATEAALAIFSRNRLSILYGSSSANWSLTPYREDLGAFPGTVADVGKSVFLDDRGITDIRTSQEYGNFAHAVMSDRVRRFINQFRSLAITSCASRDQSQYRLFFSNRYALYLTLIGNRVIGILPQLFTDVARCVCSLETNDGTEVMLFGTDSGFVMQMDKGTSFDGGAIDAYIVLSYTFSKSPRAQKRYRDALIEVTGEFYTEFYFGYTLGYESTEIQQPADQSVVMSFLPSYWDTMVWDSFYWDGRALIPSVADLRGEAENISMSFRQNDDYFDSFTITGVVLHYTPRRQLRYA